jgi:hypothetical protein
MVLQTKERGCCSSCEIKISGSGLLIAQDGVEAQKSLNELLTRYFSLMDAGTRQTKDQ